MESLRETFVFKSPVGRLKLTYDQTHIYFLWFDSKEPGEDVAPLPDQQSLPANPLVQECIFQLREYFAGTLREFNLPLKPEGTDFQLRVWKELQKIPYGRTITYLQLAARLGDTKSIRAAGTANGKNPIPVIIPCHRVIGSDGKLIGFGGGLWRKNLLLGLESKIAHGTQELF